MVCCCVDVDYACAVAVDGVYVGVVGVVDVAVVGC